ncbi:MAG: prephenate dehydrogenase/arogenate dehydrogenase family protein [Deltaproteobacteria bacterium]|nr:prephenate dehydrogenase/arogenate dehydrogenase family protein [Deltaproteobacteria bacterium]
MGFMFRRMVVAGVGLIGGSLALAARRRGLVEEIVGFGRGERNLRAARKERMVDHYFLREEAFPEGVDLLILATPVQAVVPLTDSFLPALEPGCVVSDVGSAKAKIVREMEKLLPVEIPFVGGHPIAGSEQWGAQAAVPDLFSGRRCILTPTSHTDRDALRRISSFWRRAGARVEIMDPEVHDRILAVVSHLPHVLAYAMVNALGRTAVDSIDPTQYCGGGFKDFTRIAASRPEIWRDICLVNRRAIGKYLTDYINQLERLRRWIRDGRGGLLQREFARASVIRRQMI